VSVLVGELTGPTGNSLIRKWHRRAQTAHNQKGYPLHLQGIPIMQDDYQD